MLNNPVKPKTIGFLMLIPAILVLCLAIIAVLIVPAFGLSSGVSFLQLLPFLFLMFFTLIVMSVCIYVSIRYLKGKPFKENRSLGIVLVFSSLFYFVYTLFGFLLSNFLLDNQGGYLQPIVAFMFLLIFLPLGLGFKNGYR